MSTHRCPRSRKRAIAIAVVAVLTTTWACGPGGESNAPRVFGEAAWGFRTTLPEGWRVLGEEARSREKTLLSVQIHSLEGGERNFLAGLPESVVPQLELAARGLFGQVGAPARAAVRVGGVEALELVYPVSARAGDAPGRLLHWVLSRGERLYIFRGTLRASGPESDVSDIRQMLASLEWLDAQQAP